MQPTGGYQLQHFLREGGSSLLYESVNIQTNESAVAKFVPFKNNKAKIVFENEKSILSELQYSPHVIPLIEHETQANYGVLILARMKCDLMDLIEEVGKFDERTVRPIFHQVCQAVKACHDKGIAHLDIKPENILQSYSGEFYLADFGGAKRISELFTTDCIFTGTLAYSAPEIRKSFSSLVCPFAADVWSLGIVLFCLLTGSWPFTDIENLTPETPIELARADLSPLTESLLKTILQTNAKSRPTVDQLLAHPWFLQENENEQRKKRSSPTFLRKASLKRKLSSVALKFRNLKGKIS